MGSRAEDIGKRLEERYGELGRGAVRRLEEWMSGRVPFAYPEVLEQHLDEARLDLILDAFFQILPFGTGGRRGKVGYGANRMNPSTLAMTVQGHCAYLQRAFAGRPELTVVVANDVRAFHDVAGTYRFLGERHPMLGVSSRSLAKMACEIYAGNGIAAYITEPESDSAVLSTPELSFVIGELDALGGVNLSASHNPPDDNGIKVYDEWGSQPVPPHDQMLIDTMETATGIRQMPFDEALRNGLIRAIPEALHEKYIETYVRMYGSVWTPDPKRTIVYTPLCGCGLTTVGDVLGRLGFPVATPPDQGPDGTFAVIPLKAPNPEVPQSTQPAKEFADRVGSRIVLSSDPDADRVGVEIKLDDGSWYHVDGNQIAAILCYYLMLDPLGPRRQGLVIETLVTTRILSRIVERAGNSVLIDDLLVGFKYVADVLKRLERGEGYNGISCRPDQLVLATEESHGVVLAPNIRDKDSTPACMYLAALYQRLQGEGRTLLDYYAGMLRELGNFDSVSRSITMIGAAGVMKRDSIMESLRQSPPEAIGPYPVRRMVDHWDQSKVPFRSETDRLPRNVLQYSTDAFILTIRPSGTEPKLKLYCEMLPDGATLPGTSLEVLAAIRHRSMEILNMGYQSLLARVGVQLGEAAMRLPDIVDLERKQQFESTTVPAFRQAVDSGAITGLERALEWWESEAAYLTPGANPLPALREPLAELCTQWTGNPVVDALGEWARSR